MVGLGVVMLAAPDAVEGPVLLPISPGHALSRLDAIGADHFGKVPSFGPRSVLLIWRMAPRW